MKNKIAIATAFLAVMFAMTGMAAAANISGMKFNDFNNNGIRDIGEPGLANWTITLTSPGQEFPISTLTDSNGNYTFSGLAPGNYTVGEVLQIGWEQTAPPEGTYNVTLAEVDVKGKDFGNFNASANIVELSGVLSTVWPDIGPGLPPDHPAKPEYLLVDDAGQFFALDLDEELTKEESGPLRFDRKRVHVTGILDPETNRVKVLTIDLEVIVETPPIVDSHLWAAHRSGSQRWATILCRFGDATGVTPQPRTFFEDLMTFMDGYWRELSYNNINLGGSGVFGWYNMPQSRAAYLDDPTTHFAGHTLNFGEIAQDCTAAADADVNFPDFDGINLIFNQDLDCCSWGGGITLTRDGATRMYSATWMATWGWGNQDVLGQEMGHGFGLPHSSGPYTATYDSQWDVMSAGGTCSSPDPRFGCIGVNTVAVHKDALGWIPGARRYAATTAPDQRIFIERLAQPEPSGFFMAQIPIGGSTTNFYTIASRKLVGFDTRVPGEAVVIHKVDTTRGDRVAQVVDADGNGNPNDAGAMWLPGELFRDTVNNIAVAVIEETASGFWVIINPTKGSISGMKFNDLNGNGINDAEPGLDGWTITLTGPSGTISTVTSNGGKYKFEGLATGTYTIGEILQPGWKQTAPAGGTYTITLSPGQIVTGKDFGNKKFSISGVKFNDKNNNKKRDMGEEGLAGWRIKLQGYDTLTRTTVDREEITDANGNYGFMDVTPGFYVVYEIVKSDGWVPTTPVAKSINLKAGETINVDFGNRKIP